VGMALDIDQDQTLPTTITRFNSNTIAAGEIIKVTPIQHHKSLKKDFNLPELVST
jgi:hypothetical protein